MLTAHGDEADRVVGLELGADDYVAKPFSPRELLARLRAVLRRARPDAASERLVASGIAIDLGARSVRSTASARAHRARVRPADRADAPRRPRRAARGAAQRAGRGDVTVSERTVDVHISRLRKKLGDEQRIRTVRGVGYVLPKA